MAINVTIADVPEAPPEDVGVDVDIADPPKIKVIIPNLKKNYSLIDLLFLIQ